MCDVCEELPWVGGWLGSERVGRDHTLFVIYLKGGDQKF